MNGPAVPPEILPKHSYGPIAAAQNSADGPKWSLLFSWRCFQYTCMGSLMLAKNTTDGMKEPTTTPKMLPKHLYGPIIAAKRICQWSQRGLPLLLRDAADSLGWAHHCCQKFYQWP